MKKIIAIVAIAALVTMSLPIEAFAHGHSTGTAKKAHSVCKVKSCHALKLHKHKGKLYRAHYYGDGHHYHKSKHGKSNHH